MTWALNACMQIPGHWRNGDQPENVIGQKVKETIPYTEICNDPLQVAYEVQTAVIFLHALPLRSSVTR